MKKGLLIVLCLALCLGAAACKKAPADNEASSSPAGGTTDSAADMGDTTDGTTAPTGGTTGESDSPAVNDEELSWGEDTTAAGSTTTAQQAGGTTTGSTTTVQQAGGSTTAGGTTSAQQAGGSTTAAGSHDTSATTVGGSVGSTTAASTDSTTSGSTAVGIGSGSASMTAATITGGVRPTTTQGQPSATQAPATTQAPTTTQPTIEVDLPSAGTDLDGKGRIQLKTTSVSGTTISLTVENVSATFMTAEESEVGYILYDKNGAVLKEGTLYIGTIRARKANTYELTVPAETARLELTDFTTEYWGEWK